MSWQRGASLLTLLPFCQPCHLCALLAIFPTLVRGESRKGTLGRLWKQKNKMPSINNNDNGNDNDNDDNKIACTHKETCPLSRLSLVHSNL